jgi:KDO2-lipid IV(A) lauroyltransferase
VFWRKLLHWAVLNVPIWLEPAVMAQWAALFLLAPTVRRALLHNLAGIFPGSSTLTNLVRAYRVLWNFAWTLADNVRFKEDRVSPDWEFVGLEHFEHLHTHHGGAIILTAHMGSYDLGAHLFAERSNRKIVMVRAPETDPATDRFEQELHQRAGTDLKIDFNSRATELALDLLGSLREGHVVAIQGDRVTPGIASLPATLFGKRAQVPAGPFALAMSARVPIYPLFIFRLGRRRYRVVTGGPIEVVRTSDRGEAFARAVHQWTDELEGVLRFAWFQWFAFTPFYEKENAA